MRTAPIDIRPFSIERDLAQLRSWWDGHQAIHTPEVLLQRGWIASGGGVDIAACFMFLDEQIGIGVVEYMTTNPKMAFSSDMLAAVKQLYARVEAEARAKGCLAILSFVKPDTGESRLLVKLGYARSQQDPGHIIYAKPLFEGAPPPPKDGIIH